MKIRKNHSSRPRPTSLYYWAFFAFIATVLNVAILLLGRIREATVCASNNKSSNNNRVVNDHLDSFAARVPTGRLGSQAPQVSSSLIRDDDACHTEFQRVTANQTRGLTSENMKRSWTHIGSRKRLAKLGHKLQQRQAPVTAVVTGGSISLGHGVIHGLRYSDRLEQWMNEKYPLIKGGSTQHQVLNKGSHGADVRQS